MSTEGAVQDSTLHQSPHRHAQLARYGHAPQRGTYSRNFAAADEAQYRHAELEAEFHAANGVAALRATRLTDEQVGIAEAAFKRLEKDEDLLTAVDHWLRTGKPTTIKERRREMHCSLLFARKQV